MRGQAVLVLGLVALGLKALSGLWPALTAGFDPLLMVSVLAALSGRTGFAMASALFTGALSDAWSSAWFGQAAFTHLVIAYVLAWLARRVDLNETLPALVAMVAASLASWGLQVGVTELLDHRTGTLPAASSWMAAAVLNALFGALAAYAVKRRAEGGRL